MRKMIFLLLAIFTVPVNAADTQAGGVTPSTMSSGSLLFTTVDGYRIATRVNTSIDARVRGIVARVSVRQEFKNDGANWVEGVYVFPLPDRAAVDHLLMYVGDRIVEGEIREKQAAREAYQKARDSGSKASLVEQQRANLFMTSVANIGPGEAIVIEIEYLETLRYEDGSFSLRIPTAITPRYVPGSYADELRGFGWSPGAPASTGVPSLGRPGAAKATDNMLTFSADLDPGVPLEYVASRYHAVSILKGGERYQVGLSDGELPLDRDLELTWKPVPDTSPRAMLFTETLGGEPHALLMMLPPDEFAAPAQALPRELLFVIDTSGSMHGASIEQAKGSLGLALDGLRATDRFNIVQFNSSTSSLFEESVPANARNLELARRYARGLTANGGTEMQPAIETVLASETPPGYLRQIIFMTDGSVANEEALFRLIEGRLGNARLFTVGIGSAPNGWFMRKAAEAGRGTFTMIGDLHEVAEKMERLVRKLEQPSVTDISVRWPGGGADSYPATIPDLYAGEPVVVSARLPATAPAGAQVTVQGTSALGSWEAELDWTTGAPRSGIAALWARSRIEDLLDDARRGLRGEDDVRQAVVDTALKHGLVSKYTSLVAIDKTPARPPGARLANERVRGRLPFGQGQNAIHSFPATATNGRWNLLQGALYLAAALVFASIAGTGRRRRDVATQI